MMTRLPRYILETLRSPREQLSRGQKFLRKSYELIVYCYRELKHQRADGMAAELTYRTIFALIPVVVLGLVMFRVVGGLEDVQAKVESQLFSFFGVPEVTAGYSPSTANESEQPTSAIPIIAPRPVSEPDSTLKHTPKKSGTALTDSTQPKATHSTQTPRDNGADEPILQTEPIDTESITSNANNPQSSAEGINDRNLPAREPSAPTAPAPISNHEYKQPSSLTGQVTNDPPQQDAAQQARISIRHTLHDLADKVSSVDFASIGVFGLLLFTYAAVALANAAEHLFNRIYQAPSKRPAHLRLAIHWSILTLGGGLLAMSLYLSGQLVEWFGNMEGSETLKPMLTHCVSLLASWILLFLVYALMPNTRVSVSAAAIGSAVSAVLWELAKYGFQIYLSEAVPYSLYGSLGLIPLFLFWIYLTWLVVLFGLILTYTLQVLGGHLPDEFETEDSATLNGDPDWMLPIMCEVVNAFDTGLALDHQSLANRIGLSTRTVNELVSHLTEANLLRQVNLTDSHIGLTLARPADKITLVEILDLAADICPPHKHPAWKTFSSLKEAERQAAQGKTLADAEI